MLELLAGAGIFAAGWLAGRMSRKPKNKTLCECGHSIGFHVDRTGACKAQTYLRFEEKYFACHCQVYSGPELITAYTNLGITTLPPASKE